MDKTFFKEREDGTDYAEWSQEASVFLMILREAINKPEEDVSDVDLVKALRKIFTEYAKLVPPFTSVKDELLSELDDLTQEVAGKPVVAEVFSVEARRNSGG